ncbi:MAG: hypothetical protein CM1200mP32_11240 [Methanobacteriota archaeon]|nr:MAG: hypothetical protein CM1200mP32_11240 [Euryarchaeota archaeon]
MPVSIGVASLTQAEELVEVPNDVRDLLAGFPDGFSDRRSQGPRGS